MGHVHLYNVNEAVFRFITVPNENDTNVLRNWNGLHVNAASHRVIKYKVYLERVVFAVH